jgi:hypothetical protein
LTGTGSEEAKMSEARCYSLEESKKQQPGYKLKETQNLFNELDGEVAALRAENNELREALEKAKTLLCDKYEFEESAKLSRLLHHTKQRSAGK